MKAFAAAALLAFCINLPAQEAHAQNPLGGALLGGVAGGVVGGIVGGGRPGGVLVGAAIGASLGAIVAAQGQQRRGGYYLYKKRCYFQQPDGGWYRVNMRNCR